MKITHPYLCVPIGNTARAKKVCLYKDKALVLELDAPIDPVYPDYEHYVDLSAFLGQELTVVVDPDIEITWKQADEIPPREFYREKHRPQVHFSAKTGWINDPNGLVFDGEQYHLFYQHNPYSHQWGNMHWGHAVSPDLLHWEERTPALYPDELGTMFSGSAIIDRENRTGLKSGENDVILFYYTAAGGGPVLSRGKRFTQCLAYTTDNGKTFHKYEGNPVVDHIEAENRDPKVIFVPELSAYVMALYLNDNRYTLLTSDDLLHWKPLQELSLPGDAECPDLYPLDLDGDPQKRRWVLSGASDRYLVGEFKSGKFRCLGPAKRLHYGSNSYAAQTFSDIPAEDGRRIRIAWNTTGIPDSYFCGSMCIPCEMKLETIDGEETLTAWPVEEVSSLFAEEEDKTLENLAAGTTELSRRPFGPQWLEFTVTPSQDSVFELSLFGMTVEVNVEENAVRCMDKTMPLCMEDGKIHLLILADAMGFEIYGGRGQAFLCMGFCADDCLNRLNLTVKKGSIKTLCCRLAALNSVWPSK